MPQGNIKRKVSLPAASRKNKSIKAKGKITKKGGIYLYKL